MTASRWLEMGDFLGKLGIGCFFTITATLKLMHIFATLRDWHVQEAENRVLALMSDAASVIFLLLVAAVAVFRLKPLRTAAGIEPRVTALTGTFLLMFLAILSPPQTPPFIATIAGLCLTILGSLLSAYVLSWLGRSFSIMAEARRLITGGPYGIVRHPLYVTEEIAVLGMVLLHWSPIAVVAAGVQLALQLRRMHNEEKVLGAAFPEYAAYAKRTPRFIPALRSRRQPA